MNTPSAPHDIFRLLLHTTHKIRYQKHAKTNSKHRHERYLGSSNDLVQIVRPQLHMQSTGHTRKKIVDKRGVHARQREFALVLTCVQQEFSAGQKTYHANVSSNISIMSMCFCHGLCTYARQEDGRRC